MVQNTLVWNLDWPHDLVNLVETLEMWRQPSVHTDDLFVDDGTDRHDVEAIRKGFPEFEVVSTLTYIYELLTLIVETVNAIDAGTLMVTSQEEEVLGVLDFIGKEQTDSFYGLFSSVDVVSQEQVIGFWREAAIFEDFQKVWVLSMDIAYTIGQIVPQILMGASSSKSIG